MATREQIQERVENALEMSSMIGNPAALDPQDMGLYEDERDWDKEDLPVLFSVLSTLYGPPALVSELRWAREVFAAGPEHPAYRLFSKAHEFPTENTQVSVYAQFDERRHRVVYLIGAPEWGSNE